MVLQSTGANGISVYTVSGSGDLSRRLPDWLARQKRKQLKKDIEWRTRIELIQDFEFPEASNKIRITKDGKHVMATGVYKPQIRVYEFDQLAMKFERHTDAETVAFELLSDDWTKSVLLQSDRSVEFHAQGGIHYRTRIPKMGRDLSYHYQTCDLLIGASSNEVYRLNLDQGCFKRPLATTATEGINVTNINPAHQLYAFGAEDGFVEFWDPRTRDRIGKLTPRFNPGDLPPGMSKPAITALTSHRDGVSVAVGTSSGHVLLYDLRGAVPLLVRDHQYGLPIKSIHWHDAELGGTLSGLDGSNKIISSDKRAIKIWDRQTGAHWTAIEPTNDINDVCPIPGTGMIFTANEGIAMHTFYIPALGPAPRWCSFLDNITEEMEENPTQSAFEDYKFVTRKELEALSLDHLIGTNMLKVYMHGFFIDLRLYEKAKAIANPFAYEDYRKNAVRAKIEQQRASRIRAETKMPKVNRTLAERVLLDKDGLSDKQKQKLVNVMQDERFADVFKNPEFEIDEESAEWKAQHTQSTKIKEKRMASRQQARGAGGYDSDEDDMEDD
ncbi:WD40 repeat-like protein [Ramicandelaber brevisporus]|nr:WD40 repeat-like protein [Ramicandelaber brevisporus]